MSLNGVDSARAESRVVHLEGRAARLANDRYGSISAGRSWRGAAEAARVGGGPEHALALAPDV